MSWIKARYKTSSGPSKWHYLCVDKEITTEEIEGRIQAPTWSFEHYRGIEIKKVKESNIPKEIIDETIKKIKSEIKHKKLAVSDLSILSKKCKNGKIKDYENRLF